MTNREKLIELLQERDGKVKLEEISRLIGKTPLGHPCPDSFWCPGAYDSCCEKCAAKWLNEEARDDK